jgi:polysaccharide biosynthesis protein PslG
MSHLRPQIVAAASVLRRVGVAVLVLALCAAASPATGYVATQRQNPRFGFAAGGDIQNLSSAELARYLDGVQATHAGWVRIDINWNVIQYSGPTSYDWARFDNVVEAVTSRGMKVLAGILYTPPWARPDGTSASHAPTHLVDYAIFVRAAVQRYARMGVHAYEIWNEPNIANFWSPRPQPERYARLLRLAYSAVKSVDPSSTVVSAGLSPHGAYWQSDARHMNPIRFLQKMYANGAEGSFDALGWHPSNYPRGLTFARWSAWSQMSQTTPSARTVMKAHGDAAKQIWATELGFPTGSTPRDVSEPTQARLVSAVYAALEKRSWAGPAFFYTYRDSGTNKSDVEQNFGVVRYDFSPKPAYAAYRRAAASPQH